MIHRMESAGERRGPLVGPGRATVAQQRAAPFGPTFPIPSAMQACELPGLVSLAISVLDWFQLKICHKTIHACRVAVG